jgi:hypothetical protein
LALSYSVFGLVVHSNLPLPGVPLANPTDSPNTFLSDFPSLELHLGISPDHFVVRSRVSDGPAGALADELLYTSAYLDEADQPVLRIWKVKDDSFLRLDYCDGTQFWLDRSRQHLWATWPDHLSLQNTLSYVLGPVFGLVLRLRGVTCLHASAVAFGDQSVVFVGSEGAGKSTTAAALAKRGHPVLSDDIAALALSTRTAPAGSAEPQSHTSAAAHSGDCFYVLPAYPHLCLWPDSADMIHGPHEQLPRLTPDWDKRRLTLGTAGTSFATGALPLAAIYLFADRASDSAPRVSLAPAKVALLTLVANTYANNLLDRAMRAEEFAILDRLVSSVPVRLLTPHTNLTYIEQLCTAIYSDFQSLQRV